MELLKRDTPYEVKSLGGEDSRVLRFVGSDETVDRYGTIIKVDGWKLENFRKNPIFLWGHDSTQLPIGKALDVRKEVQTRANGEKESRLVFDIEFASHPFAREVHKLYKGGFLRAVSVGFQPIKRRAPYEDEAERHGEGLKEVYDESELFELSGVSVPGNPNALIEELAVYAPEVRSLKAEDLDEKRLGGILEQIRKALDTTGQEPAVKQDPVMAEAASRALQPEPKVEDLDRPITLRDLMALAGRAEGRLADCFRGLAKRTDITALELSVQDLNERLDAVEGRANGAPKGTQSAPGSYMDKVLGERDLGKKLDQILKTVNGK